MCDFKRLKQILTSIYRERSLFRWLCPSSFSIYATCILLSLSLFLSVLDSPRYPSSRRDGVSGWRESCFITELEMEPDICPCQKAVVVWDSHGSSDSLFFGRTSKKFSRPSHYMQGKLVSGHHWGGKENKPLIYDCLRQGTWLWTQGRDWEQSYWAVLACRQAADAEGKPLTQMSCMCGSPPDASGSQWRGRKAKEKLQIARL